MVYFRTNSIVLIDNHIQTYMYARREWDKSNFYTLKNSRIFLGKVGSFVAMLD